MQGVWTCDELRFENSLTDDREVLIYEAVCTPNNQEVYEDFVEPDTDWAQNDLSHETNC